MSIGSDLFRARRIEKVEIVHDYLQIEFDDGALLNVFNQYQVRGTARGNLSALIGREVHAVSESADSFVLELDNGSAISVSLVDAAYQGPEAAEYIGATGRRVVWQ